jgi:hypothetical protein
MFLRRYSRTKNGKTHVYFALVESMRTAAGPRQHVVAHLGELNGDQERRWQRTIRCYNRQGDAQQLRLFADDDAPARTRGRMTPLSSAISVSSVRGLADDHTAEGPQRPVNPRHLDAHLLGGGLEPRRPRAGVPDSLDPLLGEVHGRDEGCHRQFPSPEDGCHQGVVARLPGLGIRWRRAGAGSVLAFAPPYNEKSDELP